MGGAFGTRDVLVYSQEPYNRCGLAQWVSCSRMVVSAGDMKNVQLCGVGVLYTWGCWCMQGGGQKESTSIWVALHVCGNVCHSHTKLWCIVIRNPF